MAGTEPRWLALGREFIDASFTEPIGLGKVAQVELAANGRRSAWPAGNFTIA
ncbi:MAG: hypothetical protein V3R97_02705 [Gemmatimonadales bacterium]